ncbi:unnamed protein product [Rhodiola kirilowii]
MRMNLQITAQHWMAMLVVGSCWMSYLELKDFEGYPTCSLGSYNDSPFMESAGLGLLADPFHCLL